MCGLARFFMNDFHIHVFRKLLVDFPFLHMSYYFINFFSGLLFSYTIKNLKLSTTGINSLLFFLND